MASRNGHKPGVDPVKRTWTSSNGTVFNLKPISWGAAQRLQANPKGKPAVPKIEVTYTPGNTGWEWNPDDPTYKEELAAWKANNEYVTMLYVFGTGIELDIPADFADQQRRFFPDTTPEELRYQYVTSLIGMDELSNFVAAIMSQTIPTEAGIAEAEASFPGNSRG